MTGADLANIDVKPELKVTRGNLARLNTLLAIHAPIRSWRAVEFLVRELMRATIVDESEAPTDVVTMRSRIKFCEEGNGATRVVTLVYPGESGLYDDAISVLTPVGVALFGLSERQSMSYPGPDGELKMITVLKVLYQPEAAWRARS
jgi:regulator of nucleoside diphosphate kinase